MKDLDSYNELLLELYQIAITVSPQIFQTTALKLVAKIIGFDRAWWGIMAQNGTGFDLHSSHRYELPDAFEMDWEAIKNHDSLARGAHGTPRTTVHFNEQALRSTPGLAELNDGHDLRHALCTSVFLPDRRSFLFVSLFRSGVRAKTFEAHEIKFKQLLTPHLYACWRANLLTELQRRRLGDNLENSATAFVDRRGMIVCADASFAAMLSERWPTWRGRRLPKILIEALESPRTPSRGESLSLHVESQQAGGLSRFEIKRSSPFDTLTRREREIAKYFAQARSYKEIAAMISLSPSTVRHHLRTIYSKLEIGDKAELVRLIDKFDNGLSAPRCLDSFVSTTESLTGFDFLASGAELV